MRIIIYTIGHLKETYWKEAEKEYLKRISGFCDIKVIEVNDIGYKGNLSPKEENEIKQKECNQILNKLKPNDYLCALNLGAKEEDSVSFSTHMVKMVERGRSNLSFVIGGSLGLSDDIKKRANESVSFSKMTFPHQLARIMLLEQIYRGFKIANNEPYHK